MTAPDPAALLRACRPDLADLAGELDFIAEGDFCRAWLLDEERVVRIPKHAEAALSLEREACLLSRVAPALPVAVPAPEWTVCAETGGSLSVHPLVPGSPLTPGRWRALPDPDRVRLPRAVGSFLAALHGVDPGSVGPCGLEAPDPRAVVRRVRDRAVGSGLPDALRAGLRVAFEDYLTGAPEWEFEPAILHGDLSPGHVLVEPDGHALHLTGIIDWGDAFVGDPARDFIFLYEDWGMDFLDLALAGYSLEPAGLLLPRILLHYLADQLEWTLDEADRSGPGVAHGVAMLKAGLRDLRRCRLPDPGA